MDKHRELLKPTLLLAAALFLMTAPSPDARDISEMTAGFIVAEDTVSVLADDSSENDADS